MENLQFLLTEALEDMLVLLSKEHLKLVVGVIKNGENIAELRKLIEGRKLNVIPVPLPLDKAVII